MTDEGRGSGTLGVSAKFAKPEFTRRIADR